MNRRDRYYSERVSNSSNLLYQVGKTINGVPIRNDQFEKIIRGIQMALELNSNDRVLDIGSGNGVVTREIATKCEHITAIEVNRSLYRCAIEENSSDNIHYYNQSIEEFDFPAASFNKGYMYEVLQHIGFDSVRSQISRITQSLSPGGRLFIGGILDETRRWEFFNTFSYRKQLFEALCEGADPLGCWYHPDYIYTLAEELDLKARILPQDPGLYTSHYRFDALLEVV